ncbi:protoglobin domain-containing protein [Methylomarinum sp. Ch1-1]|uniref:Protoglobin domain-containing protein n=1 Tax=Methylomarinum roseum TaxID=3067653 RepID=A0AAU7NU32_9GAMM|nr:protoglobin domain-containing protein [Methylomarinum sp. Ch1-1]MDP4519466.1 protoglobin domain-containing protein [Methylomarinum sp. Ch1-1]
MSHDFDKLTRYAKSFSGLTPELENILIEVGAEIKPKLAGVTEDFYQHLLSIPEAKDFLEDRVESLKKTHRLWLEGLFTGPFDKTYTEQMFKVGDVHVRVNLPVEFMAGAMTLINNRLIELLIDTYGDDKEYCKQTQVAISAITGMSLLVMQQSYQEASLAEELEKFLKISGMSRALFTNLASAYKD